MAISISGTPQTFTPAFNPIYFFVDSNNKNKEGFKYVFDVYSANTAQLITSISPKPRPNDGLGVCPLNQILKSYVSEDIQQVNTIRATPTTYVKYDIEFGEEYVQSWDYVDTNFYTGGQTVFVGTGGTQPYLSGDTILVIPNSGGTQYFAGVYTVLSADSNNILVDYLFTSPTGVTDGTIYFFDKRKVINQDLEQLTGYTAFNGAIGHQYFMDYDELDYTMIINSGATFLSNVPNEYRVKPDNTMRLSFNVGQTGSTIDFKVQTEYGIYTTNGSLGESQMGLYACGPNDFFLGEGDYNTEIGSLPIIKNLCWNVIMTMDSSGNLMLIGNEESPWYNNFLDEYIEFEGDNGEKIGAFALSTPTTTSLVLDYPYSGVTSQTGLAYQRTDYYTITAFDGTTQASTSITFNVDWNYSKFGNIELLFLDRLGSLVPANFELQNFKTLNINRQEYKQYLGDLNKTTGNWEYKSTDRGRRNIDTTITKQLTLNSNWMTEAEINYLQELYSSPSVYIKENGKFWPVIVTTNNLPVPNKNNEKLSRLTIVIEYANNDNVNNVQ